MLLSGLGNGYLHLNINLSRRKRYSLVGGVQMAIGVLIVDDHPIVREGLHRALERDSAFRVLGEAETGEEAITQAYRLQPDVVLMDLSLQDLDGISATSILHRDLPEIEVVVLTGVLNPTSVIQAMQAGASGYLFKDTRASEIREAIKDAMEGRGDLSPPDAPPLVNQIQPSTRLVPPTTPERGGFDTLCTR